MSHGHVRVVINRAGFRQCGLLSNLSMESSKNTEHCEKGSILNGVPSKVRKPAGKQVHPNQTDSHDDKAALKAELGGQISQHGSAPPPHPIQDCQEYNKGRNSYLSSEGKQCVVASIKTREFSVFDLLEILVPFMIKSAKSNTKYR